MFPDTEADHVPAAEPAYTPPDIACDECGAGPGQACLPLCCAPEGAGGPNEKPNDTPDA